jgi:hypothetical protein
MTTPDENQYIAFSGMKKIASGDLLNLAAKVKKHLSENDQADNVLIFNSLTSAPVEINFRGTEASVLKRLRDQLEAAAPGDEENGPHAGPGRPKLGVVSREISLLPRHWEWLATQPGGASAVLRKLVEHAKVATADKDKVRLAQDRAYKFMHALGGDLEHYEEALRALYAKNRSLFETLIAKWPKDVRQHVLHLAAPAFA